MSTAAIMLSVREMLMVTLTLVTPFLLAAILSSFVIGLVQASSRINDLTLSFVPRFAAVLLVLYFGASWAATQMIGYIERSITAVRAVFG
ncbi:MAG: flagellar biosynthetic protein FliQ [Acetobacteraceae bacterium]|nr:flagellar biosynthetic protein FliQ [Acetobacteraceae bacterium]